MGRSTNEYGLTQKQENFAQAFIELGSASDAYRSAYKCGNMKDATIHRKAKEVLDNGKVSARVGQLREESREKHGITVDTLLDELEEARICALTCETPQSSAAVGATMGKAKILGLDKQVVDHVSTDGSMSPKSVVITDDVEAILDKL